MTRFLTRSRKAWWACAITVACVGTVTAGVATGSPATGTPSVGDRGSVGIQRLIVGYRPGTAEARSNSAAKQDIAAAEGELRFARRLATGGVLVDLGQEMDSTAAARVMRKLAADPSVAYVEPDRWMHAMAEPTDPQYPKQWHYFEDKAGMRVPGAWTHSTGSGVTVAVIDTGSTRHSDLMDNQVAGYDFITNSFVANDGGGRDSDPSDPGDSSVANECGAGSPARNSTWHGTHVAGTIAARANNGTGVAGVAYDAKLQPVRVLGKCGGSEADIADATIWAAGGSVPGVPANQTPSKVLNLSLGGSGSCSNTYQAAINSAVQRGATVVVAAGNDNQNAANVTPANCNNVITVAATDRDGNRAVFRSDGSVASNYGDVVEIAAPGGETWTAADGSNGILSTLNTGTSTPGSETYKFYQGTSMATPHIAGLAALMLAEKPSLTPSGVSAAITGNARPLPGTCSGGCGAGLADAAATLAAIAGGGDPQPGTVTVDNPGDRWDFRGWTIQPLQIQASSSNGGTLTFTATGLPSGLSISSSGRITGTPTAVGDYPVTVTAKDAGGATGSTTFTWSIY